MDKISIFDTTLRDGEQAPGFSMHRVDYQTPAEYGQLIRTLRIRNLDGVTVSTHCHHDLGLAVANGLAGIENIARQVECAINGIGERAGNAALEKTVMATGGENAFAHEAGIHQDGMLKSAITYEIMSPEKAGPRRSLIVLGKHSGRHALATRYKELGYELSKEELERADTAFLEVADRQKRLEDDDLKAILVEVNIVICPVIVGTG